MNNKAKAGILLISLLTAFVVMLLSERAIRLDKEYKASIAKVNKERAEEKQLLTQLGNLSGPVYCHGGLQVRQREIAKIQGRLAEIHKFRLQIEGPELKPIKSKPSIDKSKSNIDFVSRVEE